MYLERSGMESLHPRIMIAWILQAIIFSLILGAIAATVDQFVLEIGLVVPVGVFGMVATLLTIHAILRYRIWRFEIREDELYLERGVITRVKTVVPYVRIQHVDSRRGPIERLLRLASTVVYTAGSRGADVLVPGLRPERSEELQQELKRLAIDSEGEDAV